MGMAPLCFELGNILRLIQSQKTGHDRRRTTNTLERERRRAGFTRRFPLSAVQLVSRYLPY